MKMLNSGAQHWKSIFPFFLQSRSTTYVATVLKRIPNGAACRE